MLVAKVSFSFGSEKAAARDVVRAHSSAAAPKRLAGDAASFSVAVQSDPVAAAFASVVAVIVPIMLFGHPISVANS
ncbi:hypothetical protein AHF37_00264 [Paragonimus kellicotti]|nr:hypothetical protein AHF37_00264 [Paragonimus kellicotti]